MKGILFAVACVIFIILLIFEWNAPITMRNATFLAVGVIFSWYFLRTDLKE